MSTFMALLFWLLKGRANGLGGPLAPADSSAEAEGDGGGRTGRLLLLVLFWLGTSVLLRGEFESWPAGLPFSESPSGICTFRRGRAPALLPPGVLRLLDREGGVKVVSGMVDMEARDLAMVLARWGRGGEVVMPLLRETAPTSMD